MTPSHKQLEALKTLGMRCLVMSDDGKAFACAHMLKVNDADTSWMQADGFNPHAKCLSPEILDNYTDDWRDSLIDLNK